MTKAKAKPTPKLETLVSASKLKNLQQAMLKHGAKTQPKKK